MTTAGGSERGDSVEAEIEQAADMLGSRVIDSLQE
jgi:hypothetical protein